MTIWKLIPIDINHRDWEASRYRGEVIIRADSEEKARQVAASAFRIAATKPPGEKLQSDPWKQAALVSAVEVMDESYTASGKVEILGPEEARSYNNV